MSSKGYADLKVWQKAMDLVVDCYKVSQKFPRAETYGLTSQLQRAAVSVPANIAEGSSRHSTKEFIHFLSIARGSLSELETHVQIALRLSYLEKDLAIDLLNQTNEVGRMLTGLVEFLREKKENS